MRIDKYLNNKFNQTVYFFGADTQGNAKMVHNGRPFNQKEKTDIMKIPIFSLGKWGFTEFNHIMEERQKSTEEGKLGRMQLAIPFKKWIIHYIDDRTYDTDFFMIIIHEPDFNHIRMKRLHFDKLTPRWILSDYYWLSVGISDHEYLTEKPFRRFTTPNPGEIEYNNNYFGYDEIDKDERFMLNHLANTTWLLSNEKIEQKVEEIKPDSNLIKLAQRKGKLPPVSYKILDINIFKSKSKKGGYKFPNRQKPGQHTRRGHLRIYKSGKKVYIKPQIINLGSERKIYKDYRIKN
tara:strand:+ start:6703 stop:7578 length:876 start_codon:yes stop_codon:yes gene_type:complete